MFGHSGDVIYEIGTVRRQVGSVFKRPTTCFWVYTKGKIGRPAPDEIGIAQLFNGAHVLGIGFGNSVGAESGYGLVFFVQGNLQYPRCGPGGAVAIVQQDEVAIGTGK